MSDELSEVWALYAEEGHHSLDEAETILLNHGSSQFDTATIAALFRAMHTFKGNARVMALAVIESRAHLAEDLIGLVRDEGVTLDADLGELLLETVDVLRGMLESSLLTHSDVDPDASAMLADRLRQEYVRRRAGDSPSLVQPSAVAIIPLPDDAVETDADQTDQPVSAILFDDSEPLRLADDPVYRQIYAEMVAVFLDRLQAALACDASDFLSVTANLADEASQLNHAAGQMGFDAWQQSLTDYLAIDFPDQDDLRGAIDRFTAMARNDFPEHIASVDTPPPVSRSADDGLSPYNEQALTFFVRIRDLLATLSTQGSGVAGVPESGIDGLRAVLQALREAAIDQGFPGPVAVIETYLETLSREGFDPRRFEAMEFALYESLATIQTLALGGMADLPVDAVSILQLWCMERMEDSSQAINDALEAWGSDTSDSLVLCESLNTILHRVFHACQQYGLNRAGEFCMVLIDFYERVTSGGMVMGAALIELTRTFMECLLTVRSGLYEGFLPDEAAFESLFAEAEHLTFTLSDTHDPVAIEIRLGLPVAFHKVMTPESVRMAEEGLARGLFFYIIRVDLNARETLANQFLAWMQQGIVEAVSNVTVFEGQMSLFDFLIMTALDRQALCEALLALDPEGCALSLEQVLSGEASATAAGQSLPVGNITATPVQTEQDECSDNLLEQIGELVTSQAVVMHLLSELEKDDWVHSLDQLMGQTLENGHPIRLKIRQYQDDWRDKIGRMLQVETRVNTLLDSLQQTAISMRSRPAGLLLKPLIPWLEALARQHQRSVKLVLEGEDLRIDLDILQHLTNPLRSILTYSALQSVEGIEQRKAIGKPPQAEIRVSLIRAEDHLRLVVRDDGQGIRPERVETRMRELGRAWKQRKLESVMIEGFGPVGNGENDAGVLDFAELKECLRGQGSQLYLSHRDNGGLLCTMVIPLAMVVMEGMVVRVGEIRYVIPIDSIYRIIHTEDDALTHLSVNHNRTVLRLSGGDLLPVQHLLRSRIGVNAVPPAEENGLLFVVVGSTSKRVAVAVDELIGQQQILIRPLKGYLSRIRGVMGCALLGSGDVGMVLNIGSIIADEACYT